MARIYVSGHNDEAWVASGTDVREAISGLNPDGDGRIFYLTQITVSNEHATDATVIELYDSDETASVTAADQRATIQVGPTDTVQVTWPDGAMPFVTNCVGSTSAGTVATLSGIQASGYLA